MSNWIFVDCEARGAVHRLILKERREELEKLRLDSEVTVAGAQYIQDRIAQLNAKIEGSNHG